MTEFAPVSGPSGADGRAAGTARGRAALTAGALGVVYGDIGTSPLYALRTVFSIEHGAVRPTGEDVYGVISMVFWSITLVVSIKYILFVLRADNEGEGGVMALAALARRTLHEARGRGTVAVVLGVLGASLFYGDSMITPAISVLSAVEGLNVSTPALSNLVLPVSVTILTVLFLVQRWGTHRVGNLFGPVMLLWFAALAAGGVAEVMRRPGILAGLSPTYAFTFAAGHPYVAFVAMGAVVLVITGAEALYADLGHFGLRPIRRAWFWVVFPALTLNYLGQGALLLRDPANTANPFFLLFPGWARLPMVILATAATVIASQAVITGAFSVSGQALKLGLLPYLRVRHTSQQAAGQVYVPAVNWILFVAVLALMVGFRSPERLATAYGVAVTGTFLITTSLLLVVARLRWRWPVWKVAGAVVVIGGAEITFFTANLTKVGHGGWLPLAVAVVVFTVMRTWKRGHEIVTARRTAMEGPLSDFIEDLHRTGALRVPGTAVFLHHGKDTTPLALRANLEHNHVLHEHVVILSAASKHVPQVPDEERLTVDNLRHRADGIVHLTARYGFKEPHDIPAALRLAAASRAVRHDIELDLDPDGASYFLSHISLRVTKAPGMSGWRKKLFFALARNAASPAEYFHLPETRTVVVGAQIDV
ncbi:potassium transporter Kup [Actinomadura sp. SCN-SB]|uniref:potassium transporter Kup n=1 Tax=Actinomadura sp. SCN-SB TaxID=3373092 RepID=UPI003752CBD0